MKKLLLSLVFAILGGTLFAQTYTEPEMYYLGSKSNTYFICQYTVDGNGLYKTEKENPYFKILEKKYKSTVDGLATVFAIDKKYNVMYFYTNNTIGRFSIDPENAILRKQIVKANKIPKLDEEQIDNIVLQYKAAMNERYSAYNDSVSIIIEREKRIAREKAYQDSIDRVNKEYEDYRESTQPNVFTPSLPMSIYCNRCSETHTESEVYILDISNDTLYFLRREPDVEMIGNSVRTVHYAKISGNMKKNSSFMKHVHVWNDSICTHRYDNEFAELMNYKAIDQFLQSVKKAAPWGYIESWGFEINSAAGIEPAFTFRNTNKKTVKYVDFYFQMYNDVGDLCRLEYQTSTVGKVRGIGPIEEFETGSYSWDHATHYTSYAATNMKIVKLVLTYMDGTTHTIPNSSLIVEN